MIGLLDLTGKGLIAAALERGGPTLRGIDNAEAAIRELEAQRLDGLVLEIEGEESIDEILWVASRLARPALVVARTSGVEAAVAALRAGATDYLHAPFEYDALLDALERLFDACIAGSGPGSARSRFVTRDERLTATLELARSVAASDATVLIEGESGTGKELVARIVHESSPRRHREMVSVNCAALPPGLLESELFGHERGAFTGAFARMIGKFELADGSTLLLDEIGELELALQAKLLRVIQEKQVQRVGAQRPIHVDFRLVATTNRSLAQEVQKGGFREDLFYRLNVMPLRLPALRERPDDVPHLLRYFLGKIAGAGPLPSFPRDTIEALKQHRWPGNVRELENLIERLTLTHAGRSVPAEALELLPVPGARPQALSPGLSNGDEPPYRTLREMERWMIIHTLKRLGGNRTHAARELGISLRTLRNKINEYQIDDPDTLPRPASGRGPSAAGTA